MLTFPRGAALGAALLAAVPLAGATTCALHTSGLGGSGGTGGSAGGTSASSSSSSSASSSTSASSSSSSGSSSSSSGGDPCSQLTACDACPDRATCASCCDEANPAAHLAFLAKLFAECICAPTAPCYAACLPDGAPPALCSDPTAQVDPACYACYVGLPSTGACVQAATSACVADATGCFPVLQCAWACPS